LPKKKVSKNRVRGGCLPGTEDVMRRMASGSEEVSGCLGQEGGGKIISRGAAGTKKGFAEGQSYLFGKNNARPSDRETKGRRGENNHLWDSVVRNNELVMEHYPLVKKKRIPTFFADRVAFSKKESLI